MLCIHAVLTDFNSSELKLEPMVSEEKHDGPADPAEEEEIVTALRRKGGKSGQYLYLLLAIFAIIASKSCMYRSSLAEPDTYAQGKGLAPRD